PFNNGTLDASSGGRIIYDGATIVGGFLNGGLQFTQNNPVSFLGTTVNLGTTLQVESGSTLNWTGGALETGGELDVQGSLNLSGVTIGGTIDVEPGAVITVSGTALAVDGGVLVNNGILNGDVDIEAGGMAEGAGAYNGSVFIGSGGVFHPGNSPGPVTSYFATFGAGGALEFDIDNPAGVAGTNWSLWDIANLLSITAGDAPGSRFTILLDWLGTGAFDTSHPWSWRFLEAGTISGYS